LIAQSREPAALYIYQGLGGGVPLTIPLSMSSVADRGHHLFHSDPGGGIACASCHPEGGDDGHTWDFQTSGPRRTLNLRGTLDGTAPYHWTGESKDMPNLIDDVFVGRMHGPMLSNQDMSALGSWLISIAPPPAKLITDMDSVIRGRGLFNGSAGCSACHNGPKLTNNATMDVGTGDRFQVPSLIGVGWHTPLLHNGCAHTIEERLTICATPQHGSTGALSKLQIADLVAYLDTL
jgi:cytochrome c peroxidase